MQKKTSRNSTTNLLEHQKNVHAWWKLYIGDYIGFCLTIYVIIYTWNPYDLCFGWKRPCLDGLTLQHPYEYWTKLGMTKVVLKGSWGCHCCKTDRGPPYNDTQNDTLRKVCTRCRHCKTDRGPPYFRMSLRHVPNYGICTYKKLA